MSDNLVLLYYLLFGINIAVQIFFVFLNKDDTGMKIIVSLATLLLWPLLLLVLIRDNDVKLFDFRKLMETNFILLMGYGFYIL
jgi:hypothetical protein